MFKSCDLSVVILSKDYDFLTMPLTMWKSCGPHNILLFIRSTRFRSKSTPSRNSYIITPNLMGHEVELKLGSLMVA